MKIQVVSFLYFVLVLFTVGSVTSETVEKKQRSGGKKQRRLRMVRSGRCSGSSRWSLTLGYNGEDETLTFRVNGGSSGAGKVWNLVVTENRQPFLSGRRTANRSGVAAIGPKVVFDDNDRDIIVTATATTKGESCKASANFD